LKRLFFNTIRTPPLDLTSAWIFLNCPAVTLNKERLKNTKINYKMPKDTAKFAKKRAQVKRLYDLLGKYN
jgi:hypothetical protein